MKINLSRIISNSIKFPKHWIVYCLLFAITIQSLTPGVVLCLEDDGHIEVEFTLEGACCQDFKWSSQETLTFISSQQNNEADCGICVDIPLAITAEKKHDTEQKPLNNLISAQYATAISYDPHVKKTLLGESFILSISRNTSHVTYLQTIIIQV